MKFVSPQIFVIGATELNHEEVDRFLEAINTEWSTDAETDAEALIEFEGRLCYRSFQPGLNPNVTKVREGNKNYLANVVKQAHGSVAEHAMVNFVFHNVSRVFTHELVRHRVGTAISQESMRFVRFGNIPVWIPTCFNDQWAMDQIEDILAYLEHKAQMFVEKYHLDDPETPFEQKKEITSALRRFTLIEGVSTTIGWSANLRTLKNVIPLRTAPGAEEEMRLVFGEVGRIMKNMYPALFADMKSTEVNGYLQWTNKHGKF